MLRLRQRKSDFGTVQKNSFGITWSQHLSGIWVVADSIIPRTGAILLSRKALYPMRCQYFQEISLIFVVGKLRKYIWYLCPVKFGAFLWPGSISA